MKRLVEFDIAKALCIVLVVMGHYSAKELVGWENVRNIIYTFHMQLFLFASGYIYIAFKKEESYGQFLLKKLKRLMIPYVVTSIIIIVIKLLTQSVLYVKNPVSAISFMKIFYYPEAAYHLWFIWALWWMFCLVPLFKTRRSRTILFALMVVAHYVQPYLDLPQAFCIDKTVRMMVWFMLGVMCFDWKVNVDNVKWYYVVAALVAFVIALVLRERQMVALLLCPYLGIVFVMLLSKWISSRDVPKVLLVVSASSYIIYLFHSTFMGFAQAIMMKIPLLQSLPVTQLVITVAIGVAVPILLQFILQRSEVTRFLFGLPTPAVRRE